MVKYCSNCGSELSYLAERCPDCGARHTSTVGPYEKEHQKSPGLAALLSGLIPGLGQVYNGQVGKGVLILIFFMFSVILVINILFFFRYVLPLIIWSYGIYDAYQTAEWNNYYYSKNNH